MLTVSLNRPQNTNLQNELQGIEAFAFTLTTQANLPLEIKQSTR